MSGHSQIVVNKVGQDILASDPGSGRTSALSLFRAGNVPGGTIRTQIHTTSWVDRAFEHHERIIGGGA